MLKNQFMSFLMRLTILCLVWTDDISLGNGDKMKDLRNNDRKSEVSQRIQEESKYVKNSDLPKEWRYGLCHS